MKHLVLSAALLMMSNNLMANPATTIECQNSKKQFSVTFTDSSVDPGLEIKGSKLPGADKSIGGRNFTTSVMLSESKKSFSAFLAAANGSFVHILASGRIQTLCSGCVGGVKVTYTKGSVVSNYDQGTFQVDGLSCTFQKVMELPAELVGIE